MSFWESISSKKSKSMGIVNFKSQLDMKDAFERRYQVKEGDEIPFASWCNRQ